ncbi:hypothetical protein JTL65_32345, partial [Pseudomonas aeruginosa]|nr:hypothetical protein [Pseudomonas aeruginosa]
NRRFDLPERWDSNERVTWENLSTDYPDYFTRDNRELSLRSLDNLANIEEIKRVLAKVREKKAEITSKTITSMLERKQKNLEAFKALIINLARNQVMQIRNADTQQLDEQMTLLESKRLELSLELDVSFKYA